MRDEHTLSGENLLDSTVGKVADSAEAQDAITTALGMLSDRLDTFVRNEEKRHKEEIDAIEVIINSRV